MQKFRESLIPNSIVGTILRPKFDEFKNFAKFIENIEKQNLSFVKVSLFSQRLLVHNVPL